MTKKKDELDPDHLRGHCMDELRAVIRRLELFSPTPNPPKAVVESMLSPIRERYPLVFKDALAEVEFELMRMWDNAKKLAHEAKVVELALEAEDKKGRIIT